MFLFFAVHLENIIQKERRPAIETTIYMTIVPNAIIYNDK